VLSSPSSTRTAAEIARPCLGLIAVMENDEKTAKEEYKYWESGECDVIVWMMMVRNRLLGLLAYVSGVLSRASPATRTRLDLLRLRGDASRPLRSRRPRKGHRTPGRGHRHRYRVGHETVAGACAVAAGDIEGVKILRGISGTPSTIGNGKRVRSTGRWSAKRKQLPSEALLDTTCHKPIGASDTHRLDFPNETVVEATRLEETRCEIPQG